MNFYLPKRRKRESLGVKEPTMVRSPGHLAWVRGHECAIANRSTTCTGKIEAAHCRTGTDGGTSMKPSDCWSIPLCSWHHRYQHEIGEPAFQRMYSINMKELAAELWRRSPHRLKHERKESR